MINLLPENARALALREYRLRFLIVALFFVSLSLAIGTVVMVPRVFSLAVSYFSLDKASAPISHEQTDEEKVAAKDVQQFKDMLRVLDPNRIKETGSFSGLIGQILAQKPAGLALNSFVAAYDGEKTERIVISGISSSREALVSFSKNLTDSGLFTTVELPISNLSKKDHIDFSMTLTIEKK